MSESDSDLEFESADEETEKDCSENSEAKPENDCDKKTVSLEKLSISEEVPKEQNSPASEIKKQVTTELPKIENQESNTELAKNGEKQRVTLRLEKKLQKKMAPKESSSEKVSDGASVVSASHTENPETAATAETPQPSERVSSSEESAPSLTPTENKPVESSWGFGGWGTNLLTTFTNQVSQGIGTVLETVESGLGVPSPEQMASRTPNPSPDDKESEEAAERPNGPMGDPGSSLLGDISAWTKVLEDTGSKLLFGGLDTLELIGKKTIDILTEGDPGLRKKRAAISEHLTLSQILKEAKEKASQPSEVIGEELPPGPIYGQLLEDYQGLQHVEALEMLSKQSSARLRRIKDATTRDTELEKRLEQIERICGNITVPPRDNEKGREEFETLVRRHMLEVDLPFNIESLLQARKMPEDFETELDSEEKVVEALEEVHGSSKRCLALFTARCMETFHKLAELLLVQPVRRTDPLGLATHLTGLATAMCTEVDNLTAAYLKKLETLFIQSNETNVMDTIAHLHMEAENSTWYIESTFQLLVPILQERALEVEGE